MNVRLTILLQADRCIASIDQFEMLGDLHPYMFTEMPFGNVGCTVHNRSAQQYGSCILVSN
jgi:hypothetical protein